MAITAPLTPHDSQMTSNNYMISPRYIFHLLIDIIINIEGCKYPYLKGKTDEIIHSQAKEETQLFLYFL